MKETHAGGVVVDPNGSVLIVNNQGKTWSFPKGHIEKGEDVLTTAKRETEEESGIAELEYIRPLGSYQRYDIDHIEFKTIAMFLFRTKQEATKPEDPEILEARWVPPENVVDILTHSEDKEFFLSIYDILRE